MRLHRHAADALSSLTRWQHFSQWKDVMAASLKVLCHIEIQLRHSMRIYVRNGPPKFHPDSMIRNDEVLGFLWRCHPQQQEEQQQDE